MGIGIYEKCGKYGDHNPECPIRQRGSESKFSGLLESITALTEPNFHKLNEDGNRLLHACLCAYAKHSGDCQNIGWNELDQILVDAICEEIGDDNFHKWIDRLFNNAF
jgi:hypothetical protein